MSPKNEHECEHEMENEHENDFQFSKNKVNTSLQNLHFLSYRLGITSLNAMRMLQLYGFENRRVESESGRSTT